VACLFENGNRFNWSMQNFVKSFCSCGRTLNSKSWKGGKIVSVETIAWGIAASLIWLGIYQVITMINGAPLF
jgi:hypothetical protein